MSYGERHSPFLFVGYYKRRDTQLTPPSNPLAVPSVESLNYHAERVFKR